MTDRRFVLLFFISCIAWFGSISAGSWAHAAQYYQSLDDVGVCIDERIYLRLEWAKTPQKLAQGLMYRTQLADDEGMLFSFPTAGYHPMWMKNTYVPLDIVFINSEHYITQIVTHTTPLSLATIGSPVHDDTLNVIELPAGMAAEYGISVGQTMRFPVDACENALPIESIDHNAH